MRVTVRVLVGAGVGVVLAVDGAAVEPAPECELEPEPPQAASARQASPIAPVAEIRIVTVSAPGAGDPARAAAREPPANIIANPMQLAPGTQRLREASAVGTERPREVGTERPREAWAVETQRPREAWAVGTQRLREASAMSR
ncbi:MAG: hypothetical protein JOZ07_05280 [Solirubrobacterales bacterium]|nr:hypothetical protein [Solirubrobacterales bacterium]